MAQKVPTDQLYWKSIDLSELVGQPVELGSQSGKVRDERFVINHFFLVHLHLDLINIKYKLRVKFFVNPIFMQLIDKT